MEWKLFATLAERADASEVAIDDSDVATVGDALDALLAEKPALTDEVLTEGERVDEGDGPDGGDGDGGELREHLRLLVDGRDPFREGEGLDESVDDDAELALFPPVSGG